MTPEQIADALILERLKADVELFVALQYRGLLDQATLHARFAGELTPQPIADDPVAEIIARGVAPEIPWASTGEPEPPRAWTQAQVREHNRQRHIPSRGYRSERATTLPSGIVAFRGSTQPLRARGSGLFAQWVDGSIPWEPACMGWAEDDERVPGMRDATGT